MTFIVFDWNSVLLLDFFVAHLYKFREFFKLIYLLAIRNNTVYKQMWWLNKVRYDTMYYNDVVGYSPSDVTTGALQV